LAVVPAAAFMALLSALAIFDEMARTARMRGTSNVLGAILSPFEPFRTINGYGLFRVITTRRPEIIIEGSADGVSWKPYQFRWKPGAPSRRQRFAAPHQPRLDWQMWFAALNQQGAAHWLQNLAMRLLDGSPPVLGLLRENPFPDRPPRFLRMTLYQYHFSD